MSMLAGPRRKQKIINLRAKNNAWSNDNTKFGQRMLEKMGWCSGKGLGANENGITEHVVARYKNDEKGLGYEDKNDQWTKHEDDFDALLANLSNADSNDEKFHSGVSLEHKSKKSKVRVHYHKFTRGKDLSRYSEKDLANIFGKKTFKKEEIVDEPLKEEVKISEQVFTEKGSMDDYFKDKLAALKSKSKISAVITIANNKGDADCGFRGFSQNNDEADVECTELTTYGEQNSAIGVQLHNCVKELKKKKKKKSKNETTTNCEDDCNQNLFNINDLHPPKEEKTKKKKYIQDDEKIQEDCTPKKKKLKFKSKEIVFTLENNPVDKAQIPKKKKKRKQGEINS